MTRLALLYALGLLGLGLLDGCVFYGGGGQSIGYEPDPITYRNDFGSAGGTFDDKGLDCSQDVTVCTNVPHPLGTATTCDATTRRCVLLVELRQVETIAFLSQPNFPVAISGAASIKARVDSASYWSQNGLPIATPPIEIYVGPANIQNQNDTGAVLFGTIGTIAARSSTSCQAGAPGTRDSACAVEIAAPGRDALAKLANNIRTPFNVLVVTILRLRGGDALPTGTFELTVAPRLSFTIGG